MLVFAHLSSPVKPQSHLVSQVSGQFLRKVADQISFSVPASSLPPLKDSSVSFLWSSALHLLVRKLHSCLRLTFVFIKPSLSVFDGSSSPTCSRTWNYFPSICSSNVHPPKCYVCIAPHTEVRNQMPMTSALFWKLKCQCKRHKNMPVALPLKGVPSLFI